MNDINELNKKDKAIIIRDIIIRENQEFFRDLINDLNKIIQIIKKRLI